MDRIVWRLGGHPLSLGEVLAAAALAAVAAALILLALAARRRAERARQEAEQRVLAAEQRFADMLRAQSELSGKVQGMAELFGSRQVDLARVLSERLDGLGQRIGQTMTDSTKSTHASLTQLAERLAVIDKAQGNITELSSQVVALQQVLANKQTRGAFGQGRMEAIVQDGLPAGGYTFQATLSNRNRPDCLIAFPNGMPGLVVDAKFPLEAWNAVRAAAPETLKAAQSQFRRDIQHHILAIRQRYFIPGETQDTAFMFVPSESIFADIHEHFEDLVQTAHRNRVVIVSPSLLMLSIQVVQSVLRDARIREQAHVVRDQVVKLMDDIGRLNDRVLRLQTHFGQANTDIDQILTSTRKIAATGEKIEALDFGDTPTSAEVVRYPDRQGDLLAGEDQRRAR